MAVITAATLVLAPVSAPAQGDQPVAQAVRASWDGAKCNIRESANLMADADYAFKRVDGVRSFGQILSHIAGANHVYCAAARGEKAPHAEDAFERSATTRAAIIEALDDSLSYFDAAFAGVNGRALGAPTDMPFGMGKGSTASALLGNISHLNEHYGNLVTYFRIKGIVPPSSRR